MTKNIDLNVIFTVCYYPDETINSWSISNSHITCIWWCRQSISYRTGKRTFSNSHFLILFQIYFISKIWIGNNFFFFDKYLQISDFLKTKHSDTGIATNGYVDHSGATASALTSVSNAPISIFCCTAFNHFLSR